MIISTRDVAARVADWFYLVPRSRADFEREMVSILTLTAEVERAKILAKLEAFVGREFALGIEEDEGAREVDRVSQKPRRKAASRGAPLPGEGR